MMSRSTTVCFLQNSPETPTHAILKYAGRTARVLWKILPDEILATKPFRRMGTLIHRQVSLRDSRLQSHFTNFMRNVPQLEVLRELVGQKQYGSSLRIASIGCSLGAELYSLLWLLRSARPDLDIIACGLDICEVIVEKARQGQYRRSARELSSLPDEWLNSLFVEEEGLMKVRDWIREGVCWKVADACSPELLRVLEPQDIVLANNFLEPMLDQEAEACLRNIVKLVVPDGYMVIDGIILDVRTRVTQSLGLVPICHRIEEVYNADPSKRDWPWTRWSLEPLDKGRSDWKYRYSTVFKIPPVASSISDHGSHHATSAFHQGICQE